ncbi:hypothetical protein SFRURICE_011659 [Spodoptera frugiperda]|nr:hypothetical protein SFRURICE_011659 [Spodoptera frugiperda]
MGLNTNGEKSRPSGYSGIVKMDETGTNYYILVCCNKYEYDTESGRCIPTCDPPCINGTCIGGNTCECEAPLTLIDGSCVAPTCTNCEHGDCTAPDVCVCHPGYIRSEGTCKKFCDKPCISGQCVGSNVCKCHGTFMLDPNDSFKYIPCDDNHELKCIVTCRHGYCLPPTDCTCVPRKKSSIFKINF